MFRSNSRSSIIGGRFGQPHQRNSQENSSTKGENAGGGLHHARPDKPGRGMLGIAGEIMVMRAAMSLLVKERERLGDREPIQVSNFFIPRRAPASRRVTSQPAKRHLIPPAARSG